ncbi:MAG: PKD domain-containing protein, partial [Thermoplasmata archaeon]
MRKGFAFIAMIAIILSNVMVHADKPYANFVFSPEYPKVNESITFNASSSHAVNATLVNYTWDFGDGSIAYGRVVTHAYKSEGIYRVCLRVVDNKSMNSTICKNITVDSTPPTIKYDLIPSSPNGKNGWYITKVKMEIKAKDALSGIKEVRYKIDEGVWKNYSGTIYINNEGNHFIYFYAMDKGGNTDEGAITFKIDFTPPSTQFHVNKNATNGWYDEDVNVTLAAYDTLSGIDSIHYLLDN